MLIPSNIAKVTYTDASLSRRVNANSQPTVISFFISFKLIKKGEC